MNSATYYEICSRELLFCKSVGQYGRGKWRNTTLKFVNPVLLRSAQTINLANSGGRGAWVGGLVVVC